MQNQIASYLFQHKTCPLPGIGTLSVVQSAAEIDFTNKSVAAPRIFISYENKETAVAGLLNYLSAATGINDQEVSARLTNFCNALKQEMLQHTTAQLDHIGNFFADGSGNISFKTAELPAAFMQPVFAERVIHPDAEHQILVGDKETTNTVMTELLTTTSAVKDRWWIWAVVLGVLSLLALLIYFTELHGTSSFGNAIKI